MFARFRPLVVAGACLLLASRCLAQSGPLPSLFEAVPSESVGVVVVNDLQQASDHVDRLAEKMQLAAPHLLEAARQQGHLQGVQAQGKLVLVWVATSGALSPNPVAIVPVDDYAQYVEQLGGDPEANGISTVTVSGQTLLIARRGDRAVMAKESDRTALQAVVDAHGEVPQEIEAWSEWLGRQDAAGLLLPTGIDRLSETVLGALANVRQSIGESVPEQQRQMVDQSLGMYETAIRTLRSNVAFMALGTHLGDQALYFTAKLRFKGTSTGEGELPTDQLLTVLPDQPFALAFSGQIPQSWSRSLSNFYSKLIPIGFGGAATLTPDQQRQLTGAMQQAMQGITGMAFLMGVPPREGSIYADSYGLMKVNNTEQYLQRYRESLSQLNQVLEGQNVPFMPSYEVSEMQLAGRPGLKMVMDFSTVQVPQGDDQQAAQVQAMTQAMMRSLFGPEGKMTAYVAIADDSTVVFAYENPEHIEQIVQTARSGQANLAGRQEVKTTLDLLSRERQATILLSFSGLRDFVARFIQGVGVPANQFPQFPASPPVGVALSGEPGGFTKQVVVPMATLEALGNFIQQVQQFRGQSETVEQTALKE